MSKHNHDVGEYIREVIFGIQDGAIGNLGLVVGMAIALASNRIIFLAGIATMLAQAISMSTGNYLSVKSEREYFAVKKKNRAYGREYSQHKSPFVSSIFMAVSVLFGAVVPLIAFLFWESKDGVIPSVIITLFTLFLVGALKTKLTNKNWLRSGAEIVIIGFVAALAGYGIGHIFA
jgi:vacuolar iron transporter family protein